MSFRSSAENATISAAELAYSLNKPSPVAPFSNISDKKMEVIHQSANIFKTATKAANVNTYPVSNKKTLQEYQS